MRYTYIAFLAATKKQLGAIIMEESKTLLTEIPTNGGKIIETDSMGREKFWEDLGRPDGK
jgi:hypothetical protein